MAVNEKKACSEVEQAFLCIEIKMITAIVRFNILTLRDYILCHKSSNPHNERTSNKNL